MKYLFIVVLFGAAAALRVDTNEHEAESAESGNIPALWTVELKGETSTNKFWRVTTYCGQADDKFSLRLVQSSKCASKSGNQYVLIRQKYAHQRDHEYIRALGCADQNVRIYSQKYSRYNRGLCDYPKLLKFSFDQDCNWDAGTNLTATHAMSNLDLMDGSDYRMEEECAQHCSLKQQLAKRKGSGTATCNSWVVEKGATYGTGTCKLSDSVVLRPLNSALADKDKHFCGNTRMYAAGKPHVAATPAPTALAACSTYDTMETCPAEKCEWSTHKGADFSTEALPTPICQDATGQCGGDMFKDFQNMMGGMGGVGDTLNKFICNIVSVVKAIFGMVASFKQNTDGGILQAVTHPAEWMDENGVQVKELKLDHNDQPVESHPTPFPEPAKRDTIKKSTEDAMDVDSWRSQLAQDAKARQR